MTNSRRSRKSNPSPMVTEPEALARLARMPVRRRLEEAVRQRAYREGNRTYDVDKARRFELRNDQLEKLAELALRQARQGSRYAPGTMLDWYVVARSPDGEQTVFISGPHGTQDEANSLVSYHRSIIRGWGSPYSGSSYDAEFGITGVPMGEIHPTILVPDHSKRRERDWDFPGVVSAHAEDDAREASKKKRTRKR